MYFRAKFGVIHFCATCNCLQSYILEKKIRMETLILKNQLYSIWQTDKNGIYDLAKFVVTENYKHHKGNASEEMIQLETYSIYEEELTYAANSIILLVRDLNNKIIGSIRVFKWDKEQVLPIQKIFGINPLQSICAQNDTTYWHIGRFAIDSFAGIPTVNLFKQLMVFAIHPIISDTNSYMIAEADSKLVRVMNALGIKTIRLGQSVNYLASETIPICSSKSSLFGFYSHCRNLYQVS